MATNTVNGWNPLLKITHWALVVLVAIAFATSDNFIDPHVYSGYAIMGLLFFRIVWGIFGPKYARLSNFANGPAKTIQYLKNLASGPHQRYIGHNPVSGNIVMLMLAMLLIVIFSGLKLYAAYGQGPLAANAEIRILSTAMADHDDRHREHENHHDEKTRENWSGHFWKEIHETSSSLLLVLILLHILASCLLPKIVKSKQNATTD